MMFKKKNIRLAMLALVLLIIIGGTVSFFVYRHKILYHFDVVVPGKIYRSGVLSPTGMEWVHNITGFKTIINLRSSNENGQPWHELEKNFAAKHGVHLVDIPMEAGVPPNNRQIQEFLYIVHKPEKLPVIIHCAQGIIRTSMMVAVYRIAVLGEDNEKVFRELPTFSNVWKDDNNRVIEFIRTWRPDAETPGSNLNP